MGFRGLFIGIDRYVSAAADELNCAKRDAAALEALFADTLGGVTTLLVDQDATAARISSEILALQDCDADDTVVITFSGHGSETHELVAHDSSPRDPNSLISLETLSEWFAQIPARRVILILDCCFSGGIGAKVMRVEAKPRDLISADERLDRLAGDGRLIITAATATQAAYELRKFGHGILTYFLLEAMRGAEEVVQAGRLPVYRLLDYVTRRVIDAAREIGRRQHPSVRGKIDGEFTWPIFVPGARHRAAFPERAPAYVTKDLGSLASAGFPAALVEAWAGAIPELNTLQVSAVNDYGALDGKHLVVSAPTSSGKTMVGELAALRNVLDQKKAVFLLPLKALVADKLLHFRQVYGQFGIRTVEATGETDDITPILRGQYDVALFTYEKFAAIALTQPHVLEQIGVIVIDEAQMIADASRGANLEFLLTLIRMRARLGDGPQMIALSAVLGDTNGLERWLGARLLRRTERATPLQEGLLLSSGEFRYIDSETGSERRTGPLVQRLWMKGTAQDWIIPLVGKLVADGQQVIVFRETKGEARGCATYLARHLNLPPAADAIAQLPDADPSSASHGLREALTCGVAFHNADLHPEERRVVEEAFRKPNAKLRVIAATTTLAMGVNTPASSVIIAGLVHPGEKVYSVAEYKNLAGRAGRLGFVECGASFLLATDTRAEHDFWTRYVTGQPEEIRSRFLDTRTDPRSLIVRVLAASSHAFGDGMTLQDLIDFLECSFGAFQRTQQEEHWRWNRDDLVRSLSELETHALIEKNAANRHSLTQLGRLAGEMAIEVASMIRFLAALRGLSPEAICDPALICVAQTSVELDEVYFPINKSSTKKEPQHWPAELQNQGVPSQILKSLAQSASDIRQSTSRAKKAVACLYFMSDLPMHEIEKRMEQFGGFGGSAGAIRSVANRTCDLLPTVARVAQLLNPGLDLEARVSRLAVRLTHGVAGASAELARQAGPALMRGDYARLRTAGLSDLDAIESASDGNLLALLGESDVKLKIVRQAVAKALAGRRNETKYFPALPAYVP